MKWAFIAANDADQLARDVEFASLHGFAGLEFNHWAGFADLTEEDIEAAAATLSRRSIRCASLGLWGWNHLAPDAAERAEAHRHLDRLLAFGRILGAETLVTGGGDWGGAPPDEQAREFARVFPSFLDRAAEAGFDVAFYGLHGNSFFDGLAAFERVWELGLDVRIKYDPANFMHAGQDPVPVVRQYGHRVGYMHIKEHVVIDGELASQPAAGMGDVPWGTLFAFLHEHGYSGWLSMEPHGPLWSREPLRSRMLLLSKRHLESFVL